MSKEVMQKALDALESMAKTLAEHEEQTTFNEDEAMNALREALAEQPAQGCDYCNHPQYAGTKCKNCGREQPAQQEPVATLWQHGETGRTRITMLGDITDCDASWFKAADLYAAPQPAQRKPLTDELNQIEKDLSFHGLTLVKTATGYAVLKLGQITAHAKENT